MGEIIHGDSKEVLRNFADESVDLLCTDPPYGYSFMGKSWDKTLPDIEIFKECFRVLKSGAFAFVMSAPRSDVCARMMLMLEDAGFEIGFTPIYWTYASGFPKAANIGKMVDKRNGDERKIVGLSGRAIAKNPKATTYQGTSTFSETAEGREKSKYATKGTSPLEGSYGGFQPKPAVEVVIVAMKPLSEKTYVDQALKNGKGITWLDDGRIPTDTPLTYGGMSANKPDGAGTFRDDNWIPKDIEEKTVNGRFPANLLVEDDVLNDGTVQKSGKAIKHNSGGKNFGGGTKPLADDIGYDDEGGYSRFFSLDAWAKTLPFLIVPKASKREKEAGLNSRKEGGKSIVEVSGAKARNSHPTVKPLTLMSYLITLGSRPGDTVLDPFLGSGTTAIAAKNLDRKFIGIEREQEYVEIANARLAAIPDTLFSVPKL